MGPRLVPKLIEADGVTYAACGGALWVEQEDGNPRDIDSRSWAVLFKDAEGTTHPLKRVRMLKVSDLPSNAPECINRTR